MHRLAERASDAGKLLASALAGLLLVWLAWDVLLDLRDGVVRVRPFEVPKSFEENGLNGAALAELFREDLTKIDSTVKGWKPQGGREETTLPGKEEDALGEVKFPGTEFSLDGLSDLIVTALQRPAIQVTVRFISAGSVTAVSIKSAGNPLHAFRICTPTGCNIGCVDNLVRWAAETLYAERKPCGLEVYSLVTHRQDECESAARRCVASDPFFAYNLWGLCDLDRHSPYLAEDHFRRAKALAAEEPRRRRARLEAFVNSNLGNALRAAGDVQGALASYTAAIQSNPHAAWAYVNKGLLLEQQKDLNGAARMYDAAIDNDPSLADAYVNRVRLIYTHQRDKQGFGRAARLLEKARRKLPRNTMILEHLAYSLRHAGETDKALATFARAIDLKPDDIYAYDEAAELLRCGHRLRQAREVLIRGESFATDGQRSKLAAVVADIDRQAQAEREKRPYPVSACEDK